MDRIKKIKIKQQDGTMSDYYPIGADASNIDIDYNNSTLEVTMKKTPRYYENVASMKLDDTLQEGDMAITLGYYTANDGGGAEYNIVNNEYLINDDGSIHDLNNGLKAELIVRTNKIFAEQFGTKDNLDARIPLQNAIDFISDKNYTLILNKNYILSSLHNSNSILTNIKNCTIDGKGTLQLEDNIGNYYSILNIKGDNVNIFNITIDVNTTNNPFDSNTGSDTFPRTTISAWIHRPINNLIIKNITINDCCGKWEIVGNMNNTIFENNIINYNNTVSPTFDRTSMYLNGNNIKAYKNTLNGTSISNTGIESHGNNIIIEENNILNYNGAIFPCNSVDNNITSIESVIVKNNHLKSKNGIQIWLSSAKNIDNIIIENNDIEIVNDGFILDLYPVLGDSGLCKNIIFRNNNCRISYATLTKGSIQIRSHIDQQGKSFTINNIVIENNIFNGYCYKEFVLEIQPNNSNLIVNNLIINNNSFLSETKINSCFFQIQDVGFNFKKVIIKNNIINDTLTNEINNLQLCICFLGTGVSSRTKSIYFIDNNIQINKPIVLANPDSKTSVCYYGLIDEDFKTDFSAKNLIEGYLYNTLGEKMTLNNNIMYRIVRNDTAPIQDYNNAYKTGDICFKTDVTNTSNIGWLRTGGSWYQLPSVVTV